MSVVPDSQDPGRGDDPQRAVAGPTEGIASEDDPLAAMLLAVLAAIDNDPGEAQTLLRDAQLGFRLRTRRDRQIGEIVALMVAGQRDRAVGLALEHAAAFPEDVLLMERLARSDGPRRG